MVLRNEATEILKNTRKITVSRILISVCSCWVLHYSRNQTDVLHL